MARVLLFDLSRILAITLVVITHVARTLDTPILSGYYGIPHFYYVTLGGLGITLFLIISGAVLRLNHPAAGDYKEFIIGRLCRIYPAYWCSLVLFLAGYAITSRLTHMGPKNIILSITGMYAFVGEWGGPINNAYWFIGLIVVLYLLYPLTRDMIQKHSYVALFILLIVSVLSRWYLGTIEGSTRMVDWFPLCRIFEFGLGVFIVEKGLYLKTVTSSQIIYTLSALSFYVFLIDYPLLFISQVNLLLYVIVIMLLSYALYLVDNKVLQPRLNDLLNRSKRYPKKPVKSLT